MALCSYAVDPAPVIERVWPLASHITCSRMSPDGALVALGLEQGSVVVTDLKSGMGLCILQCTIVIGLPPSLALKFNVCMCVCTYVRT